MAKRFNWDDWINDGGRKKVEWTLAYLGKKNAPSEPSAVSPDLNKASNWITNLDSKGSNKELLKKMRLAWNTYHSRTSQKERKSYSHIMNIDTEKRLRVLANQQSKSISGVLEELILDADKFRENLELTYKKKVEVKQKRMAEQRNKQLLRNLAKNRNKRFKIASEKLIECLVDIEQELNR